MQQPSIMTVTGRAVALALARVSPQRQSKAPSGRTSWIRIERRAFMQGAAIGALAFTVGGVETLLTPTQAHAQGAPLKVLSAERGQVARSLRARRWCRARANAGIANFIDQQCSVPPHEALLTLRIAQCARRRS